MGNERVDITHRLKLVGITYELELIDNVCRYTQRLELVGITYRLELVDNTYGPMNNTLNILNYILEIAYNLASNLKHI